MIKKLAIAALCFLVYCPLSMAQNEQTYRASFKVACAASGDCVTIAGPVAGTGSAKIKEIWVNSSTATVTVALIKRSTADTGGSSSVITVAKMDSSEPNAKSSVKEYTSVPSSGTSVGTLISQYLSVNQTLVQDFGVLGDRDLRLKSPSEVLAINVDGAATISGYIEWIEE